MQAQKLIHDIKEALTQLRANGKDVVPIDRLENYLTQMEKIIGEDGAEEQRKAAEAQREFENQIELWKINSTQQNEMFKAVIEAGLTALKSAILVNGGAAAALLAFCGSILTRRPEFSKSVQMDSVGYAMFIFVVGAGAASIATGFRYLSQFLYARALEDEIAKTRSKKARIGGNLFNFFAISAGIVSFLAFFYGGYKAYLAIVAHTLF